MKKNQQIEEENKDQFVPSGSNQKLIVGFICGALLGLLIALYFLDYFQVISSILINVLVALFIVSVILVLIYMWFKDRLLKHFFRDDLQTPDKKGEYKNVYFQIAKEYVAKLMDKFPEATQSKAKSVTPEILQVAIWSFTRSWALRILTSLFIAIGGLLGSILLYNQNQLLVQQNEKIAIQNVLLESERRKAILEEYFQDLDSNVTTERTFRNWNDRKRVDTILQCRLSKVILNKTIALSKTLTPYYDLSDKNVSKGIDERGQILSELFRRKVAGIDLWHLSKFGDFNNVYLGGVSLHNYMLPLVDFSNNDMSNSFMERVTIQDAELNDMSLMNSVIQDCNFYRCNFRNTDFSSSHFINVSFAGSDLSFCDLKGVNESFLKEFLSERNSQLKEISKVTLPNQLFESLLSAQSLYEVKNLNESVRKRLEDSRPCLFHKGGCLGNQ